MQTNNQKPNPIATCGVHASLATIVLTAVNMYFSLGVAQTTLLVLCTASLLILACIHLFLFYTERSKSTPEPSNRTLPDESTPMELNSTAPAKTTDSAIQFTEQTIQTLLQSSSKMAAILTTDGNIIQANTSFCHELAHLNSLRKDTSLFDFFFDDIRQELEESFTKTIADKAESKKKITIKDRCFSITFSPVLNPSSEISSVILQAVDLTNQILTDNLQVRNEHIWDSILSLTRKTEIGTAWQTIFTEELPQLCKIIGADFLYIVKKEGDFINSSLQSAENPNPPPYDRIFSFSDWLELLEKGETIDTDIVNCQEKQQIYLSQHNIHTLILIPIMSEQKLWGIIGMNSSTPKKHFTQQQINILKFIGNILTMKIRNELNRRERDRLTTVVEQSEDCIIVTNAKGKILYANQACKTVTGYNPDEIINKSIKHIYPPTDRLKLWQTVKEAILLDDKWHGQFANKRKDQTLYEEEMLISPVLDQENRVINRVITKRDITEKKRLESIAEAANLMDNIGFIFSSIRHELGNPINSIKVSLSVLDSNLASYDKTDIQRFIDRGLSDIGRVEYLLKTLKNFSIFERPQIEDVDLVPFLRSFIGLVEDDLAQKHVRIIGNIPHQRIIGKLDPRAFQQVLLNLIANAVDALKETEKKRIALSIFKEDSGQISIILGDNGCGISEEEIENMFRPFFTTKKHGTGLGLVIVKKMLSKMNCSIDIHSKKSIGTQLVIIIPGP